MDNAKNMVYEKNNIDRHLKKCSIKIIYPQHWFAPVKLSTFSKTIEDETISWMSAIGLIKDSQCLAHVRAMEPRHYAGYTHSMAAYDHALVYCQYITMWLLWDDECVENVKEYNEAVEIPMLALAGESISPAQRLNPYVNAFLQIGDSYEKMGASRHWRQRFAEKMIEWAKLAICEESARRLDLTRSARSFDEALQLRSFTVGIRPNSVTLERAVGIEIPDYIHADPDYESLLDQAAKICCIVNDLVGVPKDIKNNQIQSNLILYHQLRNRCSLLESYQALVGIHDEAVRQYDLLAGKLLHKVPSAFQERVHTFFSHLRYMDSGFGYWHQDCIRYQQYVASDKEFYFTFSIHDKIEQIALAV